MKQIAYILIDQGLTTHGDVTTQINTALTTANENFTALEESVTSSTASVTELSNKVTAAEARITTLEAANVDATQSNSGKMTAAHVKALQAATDKSTKNATAIQTLQNAVGAKLDKSQAFSGSYNDLTNKPSIPTKTSDLTNNSGFLTEQDISRKVDKEEGKSLMTNEERKKLANVEGIVPFYEIVETEVNINQQSTTENGVLCYYKPQNKFIWRVGILGAGKDPVYFTHKMGNDIAGTIPKMGVVYLCGKDTYVGVDGGLSLQLRTVIEEV